MLTNSTLDLISRLDKSDSSAAVWSVAREYLNGLGLTHWLYTYLDPLAPNGSRVASSLPAAYQDHYQAQRYHLIDPFFKYCCSTFAPVATGREYMKDYGFLSNLERRFILEGGETGFSAGFSSPVRLKASCGGFGGWNFGSEMKRQDFDRFSAEHGERLRLAGFYIHERLECVLAQADGRVTSHGCLTPRERDCLLWLGRGLRVAAIAHKLGIAAVTVDLHLKNARHKLAAATREEALAKAIMTKQVDP